MLQTANSDQPVDASDAAFMFGPFRLISSRKLLLQGDEQILVGSRAFDLLVALVGRAGDVVSKGELLAQAWPGLTVEESNLRVHITALRKALGDGQAGRRYIVNSPGRGYSFVAPVVAVPAAPVPLASTGRGAIGAEAAAQGAGSNLPSAAMRVIGRDHLVDQVAASLAKDRFVTITGSGGIGKTTVALAVANAVRASYRDSVYLVDLAPVAEPMLVPSALSMALGLPAGSGPPIPTLLKTLRQKAMLLVLDNCEHVVEAAATLAQEIYRNAPEVHILATSREKLRLEGERVVSLPPLDLPPPMSQITAARALTFASVRLFTERASAFMGAFELSDEDAPVVSLICRRLDGIALAIEFAAARVETLGVRGVADHLNDRFRLLKRGRRVAHPRHQTLRATFDWSFELLPQSAQIVLRRLAVFAGPFTLSSAVAVVGVDMGALDVADEFANLVSASLMVPDLAAEPVTYRLLESTRAYALERLLESGDRSALYRRHAAHVLSLLGEAQAASASWSIAQWIKVHGHQLDNLRVALDWAFSADGDAELGIDLTVAALPLWQRMSLLEECRSRAEIALARLSGDEDRRHRSEMQLFAALGDALALRSDRDSTEAWTKALALADRLGDLEFRLRALRGLWRNAFTSGSAETAQAFAESFAQAVAGSSAPSLKRVSDYMVGMNLFYAGEFTAARLNIGRAMRAADAVPDQSDVPRFAIEQTVAASANLAKILWLQGFPDEAKRMAERSLDYASSAGHGLSIAYALAWSVSEIAVQTGDLTGAEHCLRRLSEQASWDSLGQWDLICRCWTGVLRDRQGDPEAAAELLGAALRDIPDGSFRLHHTRFLGERAQVLGRIGRPLQALEAIETAIAICERLHERWFFAELLRIKGEILLRAGAAGAAKLAEEQFRTALSWAKRQGALSWELRAATSLARLQRTHGRADEARALLTQVYGRFAEGFHTTDLQIAKAMLDDLG